MSEVLDVKVGDKVIYYSGYGRRQITEVIKITPTGRIRVKANPTLQFNKYGSLMGGDFWSGTYITKATDKLMQQVKEEVTIQKALYLMNHYIHKDLSYEKALKILEILED